MYWGQDAAVLDVHGAETGNCMEGCSELPRLGWESFDACEASSTKLTCWFCDDNTVGAGYGARQTRMDS
jgi:hypothetical protein